MYKTPLAVYRLDTSFKIVEEEPNDDFLDVTSKMSRLRITYPEFRESYSFCGCHVIILIGFHIAFRSCFRLKSNVSFFFSKSLPF